MKIAIIKVDINVIIVALSCIVFVRSFIFLFVRLLSSSVGMETFYYNCFTGAVGSASNSLSVDVCQS